jgi:hypothetical protein
MEEESGVDRGAVAFVALIIVISVLVSWFVLEFDDADAVRQDLARCRAGRSLAEQQQWICSTRLQSCDAQFRALSEGFDD